MENWNKLGAMFSVPPFRKELRDALVEELRVALAGPQPDPSFVPIRGGLAFTTDIVNPDTGKPFGAKVTLSVLDDGYDLEALREKPAPPPHAPTENQRVAQAGQELKNKRLQANLQILESWIKSGGLVHGRLTAEQIRDAIPEYEYYTNMQVGSLLHKLRKAGKIDFVKNERHKNAWFEVGGPWQPSGYAAPYERKKE